jgi:hypothetical protein
MSAEKPGVKRVANFEAYLEGRGGVYFLVRQTFLVQGLGAFLVKACLFGQVSQCLLVSEQEKRYKLEAFEDE